MRSLFESTKNPLFSLLCKIVNEINAGAKLTRKDIQRRIYSVPNFHYNEAPDTSREENIIDAVFKFEPFAKICINELVPPLINDTELSWLKTMLLDAETEFLLPPDLRTKLLERLENVQPLYDLNIRRKLRFVKPKDIAAGIKYSKTLAILVDALKARRKIICQGAAIIPYRLEYDLFADNYRLIIWNENTAAVEKIPIENLSNITIATKNIPPDIEDTVRNFYSKHTVEVTLLLRNTRNAVERCFALFGSYDKHSRLQDDDTYFLSINYYDFEEAEVVDKILTLGAAVTVLTPENLRDKIIERFKAISNLYAD